jgi:hypothetical protein
VSPDKKPGKERAPSPPLRGALGAHANRDDLDEIANFKHHREDFCGPLIRELLEQSDFEGREALLAQVDGVEYIDGPVTMMCLRVAQSFPPSSGVPSPVPNDPIVLDETGEPIGGLLLWLDDAGYIVAWSTGGRPTRCPQIFPVRIASPPGLDERSSAGLAFTVRGRSGNRRRRVLPGHFVVRRDLVGVDGCPLGFG